MEFESTIQALFLCRTVNKLHAGVRDVGLHLVVIAFRRVVLTRRYAGLADVPHADMETSLGG